MTQSVIYFLFFGWAALFRSGLKCKLVWSMCVMIVALVGQKSRERGNATLEDNHGGLTSRISYFKSSCFKVHFNTFCLLFCSGAGCLTVQKSVLSSSCVNWRLLNKWIVLCSSKSLRFILSQNGMKEEPSDTPVRRPALLISQMSSFN